MKKGLFLLLFLLFPGLVFAANLTDDDLVAAATYMNDICNKEKNYFSSTSVTCDDNFTFSVSDHKITIKEDNNEYAVLDYTINDDGTVTFTNSNHFTNSISSYEEYKAEKDKLDSVYYGGILVAIARGAKATDYSMYYLYVMLSALSDEEETVDFSKSYIVVYEGVTVDNEDDYALVVHNENFGDYVVRMAELDYKERPTLTDGDLDSDEDIDSIDSFEISYQYTKINENDAKVDSVMVVDSNADFSKVDGMASALIDFLKNDPVKEVNDNVPKDNTKQEDTTSKKKNPKTGAFISVGVIIIMIVIATLGVYFSSKKNIKKI